MGVVGNFEVSWYVEKEVDEGRKVGREGGTNRMEEVALNVDG